MNTRPHLVTDNVKPRQREVATLACEGLSNKMIANKLGVTEGTVKIHLNAIYEKLDVRSRGPCSLWDNVASDGLNN